jgi:hypothetical protein
MVVKEDRGDGHKEAQNPERQRSTRVQGGDKEGTEEGTEEGQRAQESQEERGMESSK